MYEDNFELDSSNSTPIDYLFFKEFLEGLLKFGSFVSIIENKRINTTTLFSLLLENGEYQKIFLNLTASDNLKSGIKFLLQLHPKLVKSKITKVAIKKLNGKSIIRTRKVCLQQTSRDIKKSQKQAIQNKKKF